MAKLGISTGTTPNDGTGDTLLAGAVKINKNFDEIYNFFGDGNNLTGIAGTWRVTSVGIHTLANVGIGTTNPTSKLTVTVNSSSNAVRITQTGSGNALVVEDSTNPDSTPFVVDSIGSVGIGTSIPTSKLTVSSNSSSDALRITQSGSGNAFRVDDFANDTSPFVIDKNGSVGIGTTLPTLTKLQINSYASGTDALRITQFSSGNAFRVDDVANDTTPFVIDGGGNVGIGTTLVTRTKLQINSFTGGTDALRITQIGNGYAFRVDDSMNDSTPFVIDNAGRVGVGTTITSSKLNVLGDSNFIGVVTATAFVGDGSGLTNLNGVGSGVVIYDDTSLVGTAGTIVFGTNLSVSPISAGVVTVTASGGGGGGGESYWTATAAGIHTLSNVGIGTTNPGEKLQVDGNIRVGGSTTSNYIAFYGTFFDGPGNTAGQLPYQHTYIGERIYDYSGIGERSELLLFKGNDISGQYGPDRIRLFAGEHRFDVIGFDTSGTFEQVGVSTAAINKLTITSTGVGIQTTNPTSALTVSGQINSTTLLTGSITGNAPASVDNLYLAQNSLSGLGNIAIGDVDTLGSNSGSNYNIAIGQEALNNIKNGDFNIAIGYQAGNVLNASDSNYGNNVFIGYQAALNLDGSNNNVSLGFQALRGTTDFGSWDNNSVVSIGAYSGLNVKNTRFSTFVGYGAGRNQASVDWNTFLGYDSGINLVSGNYNIYIGAENGKYSSVGENRIVIGNGNGSFSGREFDAPTSESKQLAIGFNTSGNSEYWLVGNQNLNVGIGTTNPTSKLQVERYGVSTGFGTFTASAGITTDIDTFNISVTDFKTVEYTLHFIQSGNIQSQKVLIMQNGTTAYSQEYAVMSEPNLIVSVGATVSSGVCKLQVTPEGGISGLTTYRFVRQGML